MAGRWGTRAQVTRPTQQAQTMRLTLLHQERETGGQVGGWHWVVVVGAWGGGACDPCA